jgi:hypothetical protein
MWALISEQLSDIMEYAIVPCKLLRGCKVNVFAVSRHPWKCARALDDLRLNKMMLETAQILCTVVNLEEKAQRTPYRSSHVGNDIIKWAHANPQNWSWLYILGEAYGDEIIHRTGRRHASHLVVQGFTLNWPWLCKPPTQNIEFINRARHLGLGLDFTDLPVHEAYKAYLNVRWDMAQRTPRWTNRNEPSWRRKGPSE